MSAHRPDVAVLAADAPADLDALPDAVLVVGADGCIRRANRAAERLLGYGRDELVGSRCVELLDTRAQDGSEAWPDGWRAGSPLRRVAGLPEEMVTVRRRDGQRLTVAVTGAYRRTAVGAFDGVVLCVRAAVRRTPDPPVGGTEVVAAVSHELRSPLISIKGYTSLLLSRWDDFTDEDKRMMLGQVHHDADRVTRLIGELLDISRLETGKLALRGQFVDLPRLTGSVVAKVGLEYPMIDARCTWAPGFPLVWADPDKVEQVLTNLVENACKYASPLGLAVTGAVGAGAVSVTVTDRGLGIPGEELPRVFEKFFRRSLARPTGSGLGLWISRGLVEAHGGRLVASSTPGEGSAFSFTLPLVAPEDPRTP